MLERTYTPNWSHFLDGRLNFPGLSDDLTCNDPSVSSVLQFASLIFVATLFLISLTAVFIILNISSVIPSIFCNCILSNTPGTLDMAAFSSTTSLLSSPIYYIVFE